MALTEDVKEELSHVAVAKSEDLVAEVASMLRYTGSLHLEGKQLIVESVINTESVAHRLRNSIEQLYDLTPEVDTIGQHSQRRSPKFTLRWREGGLELARRTEIIDRAGRPVRGLPRFIIGGTREQCIAAWRGAFLTKGSLTAPGRSTALEITAAGNEAALALVGAARRFEIPAKTKEARGMHRVIVKESDKIGTVLELMGAREQLEAWERHRQIKESSAKANRMANFDDANLRRSARAAVAAAARVERALAILGEDVPEHLAGAGQLRVEHRHASLEELGQLATPQMTKDAVAGRIRRLLSMADKRAEELGIPDTHEAVTDDLFQDVD